MENDKRLKELENALQSQKKETEIWRSRYETVKAELERRIAKNREKGRAGGAAGRRYEVGKTGKRAYLLHEKGKPWHEVAAKLKISTSTARRLGKAYEEEITNGKPLF